MRWWRGLYQLNGKLLSSCRLKRAISHGFTVSGVHETACMILIRFQLIQLYFSDRLASLLLFRNWLCCKMNLLIRDLAGHVRNLETVWHDCNNRSSTELTGLNLYLVYGFVEFLSLRLSSADLVLSKIHNGSILDPIRYEDFEFGACWLNWSSRRSCSNPAEIVVKS